jgi:hypothetical protein
MPRELLGVRRCLSADVFQMLIELLAVSWFEYCRATLDGVPKTLLRRFQSVANAAARAVADATRLEHQPAVRWPSLTPNIRICRPVPSVFARRCSPLSTRRHAVPLHRHWIYAPCASPPLVISISSCHRSGANVYLTPAYLLRQ